MTTTLTFKPGVDIPQWRPNAPLLAADAISQCTAWDMRNDSSRIPLIFSWRAQTTLDAYNPIVDDWYTVNCPSMGWFGSAGNGMIFHPSQGPRGTLTTGSTTTTVVLSTALPAAVGVNQLANRGDGVGFRIRIIGKSSGGSGVINERNIIGNTAGTTPTLSLDVALDWTPASGDVYEMLSGRIFIIPGSLVGLRYYDIATNSGSAALSTTNLTASTADVGMVALSELYVSCDRQPSTGFILGAGTYDPNGTGLNGALTTGKNCIQSNTGNTSTTIVGQLMPANLQTNEYVNFQVRIVSDTVNPTGVGQRAPILSHTSGASGVFTVASWPVITPSSSALFVIENNDDQIIYIGNGANVATYSCANNTWSTSTFTNTNHVAVGNGTSLVQCFGIVRDPTHNRRHSHIFYIEGAGLAAIQYLDIANGTNGTWTSALTIGGSNILFNIGATSAYDPVTLGGRYLHINYNGSQHMLRLNLLTQTLEAGTYYRYPVTTPNTGSKMAFNYLIDGATRLAILHQKVQGSQVFLSQAIQF